MQDEEEEEAILENRRKPVSECLLLREKKGEKLIAPSSLRDAAAPSGFV